MLEIRNGYKKLGDKKIFENYSVKFEEGNIYGVVGENGKGKTVLLKILCGYMVLDKGDVWQGEKKIRDKMNFIEDAGIVIEKPDFIGNLSLIENLKLIIKISGLKDVDLDKWIKFYELEEFKDTKYKNLSLGTKQKVLLIQAFVGEPKILILDECFSALDEDSYLKTKNYIREYLSNDRLIILTSHIKEDIDELCAKIVRL